MARARANGAVSWIAVRQSQAYAWTLVDKYLTDELIHAKTLRKKQTARV